jgi:hypothetical protein
MPGVRRSGFLVIAALVACAARAQDTRDTTILPPSESAVKAKEVIRQTIQALGGQAYLSVRDITMTARYAQFGHSGDVTGYVKIFDFVILPDKDRTEYSKKRNIISLWNGDHAWELDRGGVLESPADVVEKNKADLRKNIDHLFRKRMNDPGITFRYGGMDMVDLRQVDWVEVSDSGLYTTRIAIDHVNHLPIRSVYISRDPVTRERNEEVEYYSNYHSLQGVMSPLQIFRERNGLQVYQLFIEELKYNSGLSEALFTRESLEERFSQLNKGKKDKKEK